MSCATASTVDAILAITFTDKAAAELRDARPRAASSSSARSSARARPTERARSPPSTGFCARLLRGRACGPAWTRGFEVARRRGAPRAWRVAAFDAARSTSALAARGERRPELIAVYTAETAARDGGRRPARPAAHPRARRGPTCRRRARAHVARGARRRCAPPCAARRRVRRRRATARRSRGRRGRRARGRAGWRSAGRRPAARRRRRGRRRCRSRAGAPALDTPACDRYRDAVAGLRAACVDRAGLPVHALLSDAARAPRRAATPRRKRAAVARWTSPTSS